MTRKTWEWSPRGCLQLSTAEETRRFEPGDWYHQDARKQHAAKSDQDTQIIEFWFER